MEWEEDEEDDRAFAIASDRKTMALGSCFACLAPCLITMAMAWYAICYYIH